MVWLRTRHSVLSLFHRARMLLEADGSSIIQMEGVERHKARLVAKGNTQQKSVDFTDTFYYVTKMTSVKFLLGLAACTNWTLSQMDVTNAFLHSDLDKEI